jgi:hypothetical protein
MSLNDSVYLTCFLSEINGATVAQPVTDCGFGQPGIDSRQGEEFLLSPQHPD